MADNDKDLLMVLGEIRGELRGIKELVNVRSESTNKRIDDLNNSINSRIEDHQINTDARLKELHDKVNRKSSIVGGGSGALVAGCVEIAKRFVG